MLNGFQSSLPALDGGIRRKPKFKKDEFTFWFQDACKALNCITDTINSAQRKGANDSIYCVILQWDALAG